MKKLLIGSAALSALFAGPAMAADITPAPVYSKSPVSPMVPVFGWTGFYIGGNAGGHYGTDSTTTTTDAVGWGATGAASIDVLTPGSVKPTGFEGGGQFGFNLQFSSAVFGIEADAQWLGGSATRSVTGFGAGVAAGDLFTTTTQSEWLTNSPRTLGCSVLPNAIVCHRRRRLLLCQFYGLVWLFRQHLNRDRQQQLGGFGLDSRRRFGVGLHR